MARRKTVPVPDEVMTWLESGEDYKEFHGLDMDQRFAVHRFLDQAYPGIFRHDSEGKGADRCLILQRNPEPPPPGTVTNLNQRRLSRNQRFWANKEKSGPKSNGRLAVRTTVPAGKKDLKWKFARGLIAKQGPLLQSARGVFQELQVDAHRKIISHLGLCLQPITSPISAQRMIDGVAEKTVLQLKEIEADAMIDMDPPAPDTFVCSAAAFMHLLYEAHLQGTDPVKKEDLKTLAAPICEENLEPMFVNGSWEDVGMRGLNNLCHREFGFAVRRQKQKQEAYKITAEGIRYMEIKLGKAGPLDNAPTQNYKIADAIRVLVDHRELERCQINKLSNEFEKGLLTYDIEALVLADYMFVATLDEKDYAFPILIERKRYDDLAYSIKDTRFESQKKNMLALQEEYPQFILIYILEGSLEWYLTEITGSGISKEEIESAISNVKESGFLIVESQSVHDVAKWILSKAEELSEQLANNAADTKNLLVSFDEYTATAKRIKQKNPTPEAHTPKKKGASASQETTPKTPRKRAGSDLEKSTPKKQRSNSAPILGYHPSHDPMTLDFMPPMVPLDFMTPMPMPMMGMGYPPPYLPFDHFMGLNHQAQAPPAQAHQALQKNLFSQSPNKATPPPSEIPKKLDKEAERLKILQAVEKRLNLSSSQIQPQTPLPSTQTSSPTRQHSSQQFLSLQSQNFFPTFPEIQPLRDSQNSQSQSFPATQSSQDSQNSQSQSLTASQTPEASQEHQLLKAASQLLSQLEQISQTDPQISQAAEQLRAAISAPPTPPKPEITQFSPNSQKTEITRFPPTTPPKTEATRFPITPPKTEPGLTIQLLPTPPKVETTQNPPTPPKAEATRWPTTPKVGAPRQPTPSPRTPGRSQALQLDLTDVQPIVPTPSRAKLKQPSSQVIDLSLDLECSDIPPSRLYIPPTVTPTKLPLAEGTPATPSVIPTSEIPPTSVCSSSVTTQTQSMASNEAIETCATTTTPPSTRITEDTPVAQTPSTTAPQSYEISSGDEEDDLQKAIRLSLQDH